jgi:hypothetical protein
MSIIPADLTPDQVSELFRTWLARRDALRECARRVLASIPADDPERRATAAKLLREQPEAAGAGWDDIVDALNAVDEPNLVDTLRSRAWLLVGLANRDTPNWRKSVAAQLRATPGMGQATDGQIEDAIDWALANLDD